jgi:hypothetical protein
MEMVLGLDTVYEKHYHDYIRATDKVSREKILAKIEDEVGWSVGKYLRELLKMPGKEKELRKLLSEIQRPYFKKF